MASEFANRIAYAVLAVDADQPSSEVAVDAELQEVRGVLSQTADRHYPEHGHCWCRKDLTDDSEPHNEFCQRARALMSKLEIRP